MMLGLSSDIILNKTRSIFNLDVKVLRLCIETAKVDIKMSCVMVIIIFC